MSDVPDNGKDTACKLHKALWKQVLGTFLGTFFLVFVGCGSTVGGFSIEINKKVPSLDITAGFGIAVAVIVQIIRHVCGAEIHPFVIVILLVVGNISIKKAIFFVFAQMAGAIVGAALLYASVPSDMWFNRGSNIGVTEVTSELNVGEAFANEFFIVFLLRLTVSMLYDPQAKKIMHDPLDTGLVAVKYHIFEIYYTRACMDSAGSFGAAKDWNIWTIFWVYFFGPFLGEVTALFIYDNYYDVFEFPVKKSNHEILVDMNQQNQGEAEEQVIPVDMNQQTQGEDEEQVIPEDMNQQTEGEDEEQVHSGDVQNQNP